MPKKAEKKSGFTSRPPLARMLTIHQRLVDDRHPNCFTLAAELEVATKTIHRDLEFMRDQLGLPLEYDRVRHGYRYTEPVASFPTVQVSHGELVALLVAQKAVEQYRGTPFEKPLHSAFAKLAAGLGDESGVALHELTEAISFRPQGLPAAELEAFQTLASATLQQREVTFCYRSLKQGVAETRRMRPYHLGCLANQWYLIGHDVDRDDLRTFALTRLTDVAETGATFERPRDFSVAEMFSGSFSAFETGTVEQVALALDPFAARLAGERKWHPSQELVSRADGGAELRLAVSVAPDLINWILSWGAHAEVLRPASLRATIAATAKAMAQKYPA